MDLPPSPSPHSSRSEKRFTNGVKPAIDVATAPPSIPPLSTAEVAIASIYPSTLLLASLFYQLSPADEAANSYFAQKTNVFNVWFVKYGWIWTTLAFICHQSRLPAQSAGKAALRYAVATGWWILVTQWCFGPPLMDRTFLLTGGKCEQMMADDDMGTAKSLFTSAACKMSGGHWTGGHDLSGHVFLLSHASLFLWSEVLPMLQRKMERDWRDLVVFSVLGIWWWMMLMTGLYFHTATEKVTGLIVGYISWGLLYAFALKSLPQARAIFGVPGA